MRKYKYWMGAFLKYKLDEVVRKVKPSSSYYDHGYKDEIKDGDILRIIDAEVVNGRYDKWFNKYAVISPHDAEIYWLYEDELERYIDAKNKDCDTCKKHLPFHFYDKYSYAIMTTDKRLWMWGRGYGICEPVNFCPICGRKL